MRNEFGIVEVNSMRELLREIKLMLPHTTVSLVGPSGTGKTHLIEGLKNDPELGIDELIILRLQGLSSEDFRLPIVNTVTTVRDGIECTEKQVDLINMGIFKEIDENPNKTYCLFLDEYVRSSSEVAPLLFSLLEGKMFDGIKRKNLKVITAFNYGTDYQVNIDLSDDALRRRQIFLQYNPSKDDFIDFITKNKYNDILQEVVEYLPITSIVDHETNKELMQPTTFGSWALLNERWKTLEKEGVLDYSEAKFDIETRGGLFFTDKTCHDLSQKLLLLEELNTIDLQKEIIDKDGLHSVDGVKDKKGNHYVIEKREKEILVKIMNFVRREVMSDEKYLTDNINKLFKVFEGENTLVISMFKQIQTDIKRMFNDKQEKERITKEKAVFIGLVKAIQEEIKVNPKAQELWKEFQTIWGEMNRG
ncbi:MAG: ATP-binding protein [Fusobacteriaceae bacterium]